MTDATLPAATRLPPERYLELIRTESARLAEMGERGLDAAVPSCPGWTVGDVLAHVGEVYLHKIVCMRDNVRPDPWPPAELAEREPRELLATSTRELLHELESRGPGAPSYTWWPADQTTGFWFRRMAQEVAVHRFDAELAHGATTPVDPGLALDGIDEVLRLMLGGPWWTDFATAHPVDSSIAVDADGHTWRTHIAPDSVTVWSGRVDDVDRPEPAATVSGDAEGVLLWLWGRRDDHAVRLRGDREVLREFRARLAEAT